MAVTALLDESIDCLARKVMKIATTQKVPRMMVLSPLIAKKSHRWQED